MRRTGSRESRDSRDASATSPTSIAVKTFSIRFGSRRNQRPLHQKIRSITTVKPTIETIRIGHMTGPPRLNLSMRKLPLVGALISVPDGLADTLAAGLKVAVTLAPGAAGPVGAPIGPAGEVPGGIAGDMPVAGGGIGAPGCPGGPGGCAGAPGCPGA